MRINFTRWFASSVAALLIGMTAANADLINEFEPNAAGADPDPMNIELSGTPLAAFSGFLSSIEMDGRQGTIDRSAAVSGSYDANGLAVVSVPDLENPGFTLVFSSLDGGGLGADLDSGDAGTIDNPSVFGTVFDAISIPDDAGDSGYYAGQLGGQDFTYSGDEPKLAFRDGITGAWYAVNDVFSNPVQEVKDISGNLIANNLFSADPEVTTFGSINPTAIPEPSTFALLGLGGLVALLRRRR